MFEKFKSLTYTEKGMIILIIILLFGILIRWGYVQQNARKGFDRYLKAEQVTK
jgi:hypothetical protein